MFLISSARRLELTMKESILKAERISLRGVTLDDASDVFRWKSEPYFKSMALDEDSNITLEDEKESIRKSIESQSELYFMIALNNSERPIGYIRINWMDSSKRFAWLRFGLGEERGRGYAYEALSLLVSKLFSRSCHRIEAEVYDFNARSLALLERLGFKREGVKREAHHDSGGYHDVVVMGLLNG